MLNKKTYSQIKQDLNVLEFYKHKKNGFFIEIGASDGIELSNTYLLETKYSWSGICVEPIYEEFQKLVINRPNSNCCNKAVFSQSGLNLKFNIANNDNLFSGLPCTMDCHVGFVLNNKKTVIVETISFQDLLEEYNAPFFIEYLSLDTEGSEFEILKSVDLTKYTFGLIHVEHNFVEPRRSQMREYLLKNGYVYIRENNFDDCYKHSSIIIM